MSGTLIARRAPGGGVFFLRRRTTAAVTRRHGFGPRARFAAAYRAVRNIMASNRRNLDRYGDDARPLPIPWYASRAADCYPAWGAWDPLEFPAPVEVRASYGQRIRWSRPRLP